MSTTQNFAVGTQVTFTDYTGKHKGIVIGAGAMSKYGQLIHIRLEDGTETDVHPTRLVVLRTVGA